MNLNALLALFGRSVRDDTRSKTLLWARIGIAFAVLFAILRTRTFFGFDGAPGMRFFSSVVWMNFVFICAAGMSYFASSITEEKEEGTLGMLRMTELSPVAILFGKSTSRLVGGMLLLLVQVPFVMLAITLGGVRLDQVIGCYAILGAFLFFACNVGLLGSVICPRTGSAAVVAAILAIFYVGWPHLISTNWPSSFSAGLRDRIAALTPVFFAPGILGEILANRGAALDIGPAVVALLGGGVAAFLASWLLFDRFCGEESAPARMDATRSPVARATQFIMRPRPSRAWSDAICWRDFYFLHGGTRRTWAKCITYLLGAIWLGAAILRGGLFGQNYELQRFFSTLLAFSLAVVIIESLFATSRIYRLERKERTLSTLMVLPNHFDAMLQSKRRAVWISLVPGLIFVIVSFFAILGPLLTGPGPFFIWFVQGIGYLIAQLYFNHALVAWFSLRMKWGGLPLALGISWLGNLFAAFLAALLFNEGVLIVLIIASAVGAALMQSAFRKRLEIAATEE